MPLIFLTTLTMIAFAANSVLNRLALAEGLIGPGEFGVVRLLSGAVILLVLVGARHGAIRPVFRAFTNIYAPIALSVYIVGFSFAYLTLDAGVGALILFGGVQITMFAGALSAGEAMPPLRWAGAGIAFSGLVWLLWPHEGAMEIALDGALLMGAAALGWGIYSLIGRGVKDPLAATAGNFWVALPIGVLAMVLWPATGETTVAGVALAALSGSVTSGLGYALWYSVLPRLQASVAAVAQLTVPVIALAGGMLFLGEGADMRFVVAAVLVLGGVAISLRR